MRKNARLHRTGLRSPTGWLAIALAWFLAAKALAQPVPVAGDLQQLGAAVRADGTPLVLVVWAHDCPYCRVLDEQILRPIQASGELTGRVLLRRVDIDGGRLVDFDGRAVGAGALIDRYRARLTPTVLFLDGEGRELTERLVGINSVDFYPAYLDRAIETAVRVLREGGLKPRP